MKNHSPWAISAAPLGFDAISICILYPVRWTGFLDRSEITNKVLHSVMFLPVIVVMFLAYRTGYLPHHRSG
jgi:hypothetical protein